MPARFNPPPGWPPPPEDWRPTPNWVPDPSWPAPPPGWEFWLVDEQAHASRPAAAQARVEQSLPATAPTADPAGGMDPGGMPPGGMDPGGMDPGPPATPPSRFGPPRLDGQFDAVPRPREGQEATAPAESGGTDRLAGLTALVGEPGRRRVFALAAAGVVLVGAIGATAWWVTREDPEATPAAAGTPSAGATGSPSAATSPSATASPLASAAATPPDTALAALETLTARTASPSAAYSRAAFGKSWTDPDGDGCDTGNDVMARDMTAVKTAAGGCVVLSGRLLDSYIGRASNISSAKDGVAVDFVVPLPDAWESGAHAWTSAERIAFANDPANLQAVRTGTADRKRSRDASQYLPSAVAYRCTYVARQVGVKYHYGLSVTQAEQTAMSTVLATCPQQPLPDGLDVVAGSDDAATSAAASASGAVASQAASSQLVQDPFNSGTRALPDPVAAPLVAVL